MFEFGQTQLRVSELTGVPEACAILCNQNTFPVVVTETFDVLNMY